MKQLQLIVGIVVLCCFVMEGMAGEKNFGDRVPTVDELINALAPDSPDPPMRTRALIPTHPERLTETVRPMSAISMEIRFGVNAYRLTRKAAQRVDVIGRAISSGRLRDRQFIIEGHTDASGHDRDNLLLSKKRAIAVKKYLVMHFNVDPNRLKIIGKGESEPLLVDNPYAPQNRRVKIISTGE